MIALPTNVRVLIATKPVDFRKGMDGLAAIVAAELKLEPFSGIVWLLDHANHLRYYYICRDPCGGFDCCSFEHNPMYCADHFQDSSRAFDMTTAHRLRGYLKQSFRLEWLPYFIMGSSIIAAVWLAAHLKTVSEYDAERSAVTADLVNLSLLFQQDVIRTTDDLDRIIKFLRRSYERNGFSADWPSLVQEDFAWNARSVQVAIIDPVGRMITSTAMPFPKTVVDLSDREHYRFHRQSNRDVLHISRPVIGRASGKWSIQFTRRFLDSLGQFAGVIVVSLDPVAVLSIYERLEEFSGFGFALVDTDRVVRAGAGFYEGALNRPVEVVTGTRQTSGKFDVTVNSELRAEGTRLVAIRPVTGTSLSVIASLPEPNSNSGPFHKPYYGLALLVSLTVLLGIISTRRQQLRHVSEVTSLAHTDVLTNLPNRLAFQRDIASVLAKEPRGAFALHLLDLDHFKGINDTFGHPIGDKLLIDVAVRLRGCLRATDFLYRLGGDEFAIVQRACQDDHAAKVVAERICKALSSSFTIDGHDLRIGCSVGIIIHSQERALNERPTSADLQKAADLALYLAKADGRGTHRIFDAGLGSAAQKRRTLSDELRYAVERHELELHYQPKVQLGPPAQVYGFEALVRWRHPVRGLVPPVEFIGIAEENGLIGVIGEWVLRQACADVSLNDAGASVAINCSPAQFRNGDLPSMIASALSKSRLPAKRLEIEITEGMLMRHDPLVIKQLQDIRELGVRIALDDFGTGYSSLSYLDQYPIDSIKIDRSFVEKLGVDKRGAGVVRAIINLADELDMLVIAEGVETQNQVDCLALLGCKFAQGYFFGKPEPAERIWPAFKAKRDRVEGASVISEALKSHSTRNVMRTAY